MRVFLLAVLCLAHLSPGKVQAAFGQSVPPVELRASEVHELWLDDGTVYEVYVAYPLGYDSSGDTRYPVLYMTDAALVFPLVAQTYRFLARYQEAPPILLVGIDRPTETEEETRIGSTIARGM